MELATRFSDEFRQLAVNFTQQILPTLDYTALMSLEKSDITILMQNYGLLRDYPELPSILAQSIRMRVATVTRESPRTRGSLSHLGGLPSALPPTGWPTWDPAGILSRHKAFFVERARIKGSWAPFERMIAAIDQKLAKGETPLHFLAQIDLADLPPHDSLSDRDGLLLFFADVENGMCGFDPFSIGSAVVALVEKSGGNSIVRPLSPLSPDSIFADASLQFDVEWTIPADLRAHGIDLHIWNDESAYAKFYAQLEIGEVPVHRLFGHPQEIQNDMRLQCEMAANGIYGGTSEPYKAASLKGWTLRRSGGSSWPSLTPMKPSIGCGGIAAVSISTSPSTTWKPAALAVCGDTANATRLV